MMIDETGHLETCIHFVHHWIFTPTCQHHLLRKSLPKIFFHFAKQGEKTMDIPIAM